MCYLYLKVSHTGANSAGQTEAEHAYRKGSMPPRSNPTARQQRLGAELRRLREEAGLSTEQAAERLDTNRTVITSTEAGRHGVSPERVRRIASQYGCTDDVLIDALVSMCDRTRRWWEEYRDNLPAGLLDIAEFEWHAKRLITAQIVHLPGILQTEDYARGVFNAGLPPMSRFEIELRVKHRMERQQVLDAPRSLPYVAYVHEAALRMRFGEREVTRHQLGHLCTMSEHDNITVRIIPVSCDGFPGAGHALSYAEGPVPQLDTVHMDSTHGPEFTHEEAQLTKYRAHLGWMEQYSFSPAKSRDFILTVAHEL